MNRKILFSMAILMLAVLACSAVSGGTNGVRGSGNVVSETRNVAGFTAVELKGSADVSVVVGATDFVTVKADDNVIPLILTTVRNGTLVIDMKPFTSMTTSNGIQVNVVMKSLRGITLSGSGKIDVSGMSGPDLSVELPGSGDITVAGAVEHVTISLPGSGNIFCNELKASSADVTLSGSGTIRVYADQSLNAQLPGSGTIRYEGNPAQLTKSITGSGTITP